MAILRNCSCVLLSLGILFTAESASAQSLNLVLPERTRLLQDQRVDLVIEIRGAASGGSLQVTAGGRDLTSLFSGPTMVGLDCNGTAGMVYRADLVSFEQIGSIPLTATYGSLTDSRTLLVRPFALANKARNVILYIGDAMGTAYRDAGRIVGQSSQTAAGGDSFREGFFDNLQEMDKMPISGMVMTYASDRVIPDSANTASAWTTGNKTFEGALAVFGDGTDCQWSTGQNAANIGAALDNPRVETLWEYMKRKYGYRTGIVSTAFITDATPAGEGAHTASRAYTFEVARQYRENALLNNQPGFDVIMGGGREDFDPDIRADGRNLVAEFQSLGYTFVSSASELSNVNASTSKVLGLFRRPNTVSRASSGIRPSENGNMDVAYDKLRLQRPASEPQPDFGSYTDQPMLETMTDRAIQALAGPGGTQPFILMVEGASIDKQSHPNHAAGVIWDVIEMDKAVGVGRTFAASRPAQDTLLLVSADHDQSMSIIGVNRIPDADYTDRSTSQTITVNAGVGAQSTKVYKDAPANTRASYGYYNSGGDPNTSGIEGVSGLGPYQRVYNADFPNYVSDATGYPTNQLSGNRGNLRLSVGFRTGNHTGSSVPVTAEGPGAFLFTGYMDQTDLFFKMAVSLSGETVDGDYFVNKVLQSTKYPATPGK